MCFTTNVDDKNSYSVKKYIIKFNKENKIILIKNCIKLKKKKIVIRRCTI